MDATEFAPITPAMVARVERAEELKAAHANGITSEWSKTLHSSHMKAIRLQAIELTGSTCAGCGEVRNLTDLAHIVSAPKAKGLISGAFYAACKPCNDIDREEMGGDSMDILFSMVRPDLIIVDVMPRSEIANWETNEEKIISRAKRMAALRARRDAF